LRKLGVAAELFSITELTAAAWHKTEIGKIENRNSFQLSRFLLLVFQPSAFSL
jgi:hypothetical protein